MIQCVSATIDYLHVIFEAVKAHINQLLDGKVIRESWSPYASPIALIKKKDRILRMCVDYH